MKILQFFVFCFLIGSNVFGQKSTLDNLNPLLGNQIWLKPIGQSFTKSNKNQAQIQNALNDNLPVNFENDLNTARYSAIWNNQSTFFIVLQSNDEQETPFLKILDKNNQFKFTNKGVHNTDFKPYEKGNPKQGIILTHQFSMSNITPKNLIQLNKDVLSAPNSKTNIFEFIYLPEVVSEQKKQIIESYLSVKYGISLDKEKDYFNVKGDKIWKANENTDFNYRVTGLGKETELSLNQIRSTNAEKDGLLIEIDGLKNQELSSKNNLPNQGYVIWGDSNEKTILSKRNGLQSYQKMNRVWKMKTHGIKPKDSVKLSFYVDATKMNLFDKKDAITHNKEEFIWLLVNEKNITKNFDYHTATYYKQKTIQDSIVFENIPAKENQVFTFIKAPDLFVDFLVTSESCSPAQLYKLEGKVIHGIAPFQIKIQGQKFNKSFTSATTTFEFSNLTHGTYSVEIKDAKNRIYNSNLTLEPLANLEVDLPAQWQLQPDVPLVIHPNIKGKNAENLSYIWTCENKEISKESQLTPKTAGNYKLKIYTSNGCEKEMSFRVTNSSDHNYGQWSVYPNPVKQGQFYTINFNLAQESEVSILLFGINGQLLANKKLGKISVAEIKEYMHLALGEYVLQVNINGVATTKKIIVE